MAHKIEDTMQSYITIDDTTYPVDSTEEIESAAVALYDAGIASAPVYVGEPFAPYTYRNGEVVHEAKPADVLARLARESASVWCAEHPGEAFDPSSTDWDGEAFADDVRALHADDRAEAHETGFEGWSKVFRAEIKRIAGGPDHRARRMRA